MMERSAIMTTMGDLKLFGMRAAYDEIVASAVKRQHEPQRVGAAGEAVPLTALQPGEAGVVAGFAGGSRLGARLAGLGFAPGARIKVVQARSHGPLIVLLRDTRVALGAGEASQVLVVRTERGHE